MVPDPCLLSTNREQNFWGRAIGAPLHEAQRQAHPQEGQIIPPWERNSGGKSLGLECSPEAKLQTGLEGPKFEEQATRGTGTETPGQIRNPWPWSGPQATGTGTRGVPTGNARPHAGPAAGRTESGDARSFILPRTTGRRPGPLR